MELGLAFLGEILRNKNILYYYTIYSSETSDLFWRASPHQKSLVTMG
jgi:hypothetical protein